MATLQMLCGEIRFALHRRLLLLLSMLVAFDKMQGWRQPSGHRHRRRGSDPAWRHPWPALCGPCLHGASLLPPAHLPGTAGGVAAAAAGPRGWRRRGAAAAASPAPALRRSPAGGQQRLDAGPGPGCRGTAEWRQRRRWPAGAATCRGASGLSAPPTDHHRLLCCLYWVVLLPHHSTCTADACICLPTCLPAGGGAAGVTAGADPSAGARQRPGARSVSEA